ncbi:MAG: phage tail protein [Chloracidobacterium sp.]|nr:phage tail protein [Chloracidobacterium sp.]
MADPFLSEIRLMSFSFPPRGWALCDGLLLPINQNQPLFSLLGTTYGGNGQTNFALPDLRGRTPIHVGSGHPLGERAGAQTHTLSIGELPAHTHVVNATSNNATATVPSNSLGYARSGTLMYGPAASPVAMSPNAVSNAGGSQAHQNMQPYLTINFCIALQGIFPSQN